MKSHGPAAQAPLTAEEIEALIAKARIKLYPDFGLANVISHKVDVDDLLQVRLRREFGVELDVCKDEELPTSLGEFRSGEKILRIRQSILERARDRWPEALLTVYHETAHVIIHPQGVLHRKHVVNSSPTLIRDIEEQANFGAMALAIGSDAALRIGSESVLETLSGMPKRNCLEYLEMLRRCPNNKNKNGVQLPSYANMSFDFDSD